MLGTISRTKNDTVENKLIQELRSSDWGLGDIKEKFSDNISW